jgi:hypothetical protein
MKPFGGHPESRPTPLPFRVRDRESDEVARARENRDVPREIEEQIESLSGLPEIEECGCCVCRSCLPDVNEDEYWGCRARGARRQPAADGQARGGIQVNTLVIVRDRPGGEYARWDDGPVPRVGEWVFVDENRASTDGVRRKYEVVDVEYQREGETLFASVFVDHRRWRER